MIKNIKTEDYDLQDDEENNVWVILNTNCPHCNIKHSIKTLDFRNGEVKMKCNCGKKFIITLE